MRTIKCACVILLILILNKTGFSQQLRLGDNPSSVEKSAVLDLVSTNQGLLLPRITDTTLINALNPPNGMVIYYVPGNKILLRINGYWQGIISNDALKLSNLVDASISLPQNGQILQFNGSTWVNYTPSYLTSIDTSDITGFSQKVRGLFSGLAPISINANGEITITQAGAASDGYLNSSDWNTFNNKQPADNYLTGLTGDITATGPGTVAATIAPNAVTYSKIQNVSATDKVLGRVSSGSGEIEEIATTGTGDVVRSNSPVLNHPTGIIKDDVGLSNVNNTADSSKPISNATQSALNLKINLTQKGANNGVATLDGGGKVPISQMAVGAQVYKGTWSASTNIPLVSDAVGSAGDTYRVVEGGTIDLGSGPMVLYASDDIIYNGSIWQRNPATSQVTSVNTQSGTVVLTTDDVNEGYINKYYTDARANLKINVSEKGANNGVATLDGGGKVLASQLPVGAQVYKGTWNASTNSPTLIDGTGTAGWTYRVTVAGTQNLGSGAVTFAVGDDIIYNGTIWQRNPSSAGVSSVNSQTGTVVLTTDHIEEGNDNKYYTDSLARHAISASSPLSYNSTNGNLTISQANTSTSGYLSSTDWNNFSSKQPFGNYITALTGDVTASGPGSVGTTIAPNAVTYSKMQAMTANKLLGSGLAGTSVSEITLGVGLSFTGNTLNAATTGGTVTSFSAGDLSPLFTTSVSNPTTTPALSFSLGSQSQNLLFASPVSSSGVPTFRSLVKADLPSTGVYNDQSNTYTSGSKQIFTASNINADIRLTGYAGDPSTLSNGDIWYNSSTNLFKYRANGTTRTFANLDQAQTFTNKTISGASNTLTNIGNSSLTNSTIGLTLGSSGSDANVSGSPVSLGGSLTLNLPSASATNRGLLSAADWNIFNNKLSSIDTTGISNFSFKVRSLFSAGTGIVYNTNTGVITNSGVTSLNNNTGALTMDTGYISNFYLKVRSLNSVTAPLTYNSSTGLIGITQATGSSNGYLSSADWNTFNSKAGSFSTGNLTETGSGVLTITGGTGSVVGSGTTLQVKQATTSQNGFLSNTDWNTFNNKLSSIDTSNISNFYLKVRALNSAGTGISYNSSTGVISNSGVLSVNGNTGALTMDTGYINNFYLKTRGLLSAGSGIAYNAGTGVISSTLDESSLWNLTGNSGTTAGTNFIGTTDNQDLVFKTNNTETARIISSTGDIKIGNSTTGTLKSTKELVLRQDGDTYGSSILRLRNRNAENGAIFETTDPSITLVDFIFKTAANQRNIRYEARPGSARTGAPSFHIGGSNPDNPTLAVGDNYAAFNTNLKIGNYNTPTEALDITGNLRFSGALMPNNSAGTSGYILKSNGSGTAPTWINNTLGNLSDVTTTSPSNGQLLQYNGTNWVNATSSYLTTIDTSNISNFYLKVRSLNSTTAPLTYNSSTGVIGITQATTSTNGYLSNTDWNTFNNKLSSIDTSNISNFYLKVRALNSAGTGISYNSTTGVIGNSGVLSVNGNTGALTMDTGYISNFYTKVRSLHTVSTPLTYNSSTGLLGISQATTSTNGYLSSSDWNTFNSKGAGSVSSVSVVSANGFGGSVATSTTTPAITINTSVTGLLKGNGTAISAATQGTDYSGGTSALASGILKSTTGTGALSIATVGDFPTLNQNTTGNAATVTTNANLTGPITSVGNATSITDLAISTTKLANNAVTYGKMQAMTANKLLGSGLSGTSVSEITLGTGLSFTGTTLNVSGGFESPLTFSTGLTRSGNTITNDLSTGIASSNQTAIGSTNASGTLTLSSTSHGTKGKILFGTSAYDEVNNKLGIGVTTPSQKLTIGGAAQEAISRDIRTGSLEIMGGTSEATGAYFQITGDQNTNSPYEGSAEFVIRNLPNSQFGMFSYDGASTWTQRFQLKGQTGDTYLVPSGGKLGVGLTNPSALFHLKAGTATASTAPLKFTAGINLTTPENGALEYNGTNLFITNGGARETILTSASGIDNSALTNSTIGLTLGTSGNDAGVTGSPASLGGSLTLNLPSASSTKRGLLTSADWTTFNNKLSSIDTSNISNFYLKVRSLNSVSSPLTYNTSTGLIGISQATTSASGYLSNTDWNTFNNKQSSGNYLTDPGSNGIVARTSLNTTTNRTITGTTNRITLSNGDGVSGNPTIDISSAYVGQTSITTLGTIGTGTWNATTIGIAKGGTGQTTANAALNALLPSQTGNSGNYLTTDGTNSSWSDPSVTDANYLYAYSTSTKTFSTAGTWVDLTFNTAHPQLSGWSHSTSSNAQNFTCNQTGIYQVVYSGQADNTTTTTYELDLRAALDGTEIPGSVSSIQCSNSSPTIANNFLVSINSGQVLKLQMTGSNTAIRLAPGSYGTTKPTITITIIRIK